MFSKAFAVAIAAVCLSTPVFADDATPDTNGGRYTLNKVTDGFVRLDTQTGEVALCNQRTVGWACQVAPEDRAAFESEISSSAAVFFKNVARFALFMGFPLFGYLPQNYNANG